MKNIKIIEVPSEIGAGTRGASLGVEAIKVAALDFMSNFFVHFPSEQIEVENKLLFEPIQSPYAKRIHGMVTMYERVSKAVSESIKGNFFPVILKADVLEKCGFAENKDYPLLPAAREFILVMAVNGSNKNQINAFVKNNGECFARATVDGAPASNNIYHLHQLQNLYFSITGDELKADFETVLKAREPHK